MGLKRFDFKIKDNKKKNSIIAGSIIVLVLLAGITIYATFAKYKVTKSYNLIQGQVSEFKNADLSVAIKLISTEGIETIATDFPDYLEYSYLSDQSNCTNGSEIIFDEGKWSATISSSEKDKCTLYFEQRSTKTLKDTILTNNTLVEGTPNFNVATTEGESGLYSAADDYGTSYYFRGSTSNNYVQFGVYNADATLTVLDYNSYTTQNVNIPAGTQMYWRIIRINGDGSIRMIYDGTSVVENNAAHNAVISNTKYNNDEDENRIGYTYNVDGIEKDSIIKSVVDSWYAANLKRNYDSYIADNIFCNDRQIVSASEVGNGTVTNYAANARINDANPKLTCTQSDDKYTVNSGIGNGLLNYPIGLITADEAMMAGITTEYKTDSYLYSGTNFWTMTPLYSNNDFHVVSYLTLGGAFASSFSVGASADGGEHARPVINLNANIKLYGSGTASDPYRLTK